MVLRARPLTGRIVVGTFMRGTNRRAFFKSCLVAGAGTGIGLAAPATASEMTQTVHDDIASALKRAPLRMQFRGSTVDQCTAWQRAFRTKLDELLGVSAPPVVWRVKQERRTELSDHVRYELVLQADGIPSVPLYLLVPQSLADGQRAAAVVCLHGHGDFGHHPIVGRKDLPGVGKVIEDCNCDYGLQFVRRGYVVAAPCMIPFGRRVDEGKYGGTDPCAVALVRMQALGQLPITANLRDVRWVIDLLQQRSEVRPDRIGCAGLSYGGRMTMLASAVDRRIRVAAVSGALNLLQERLSARYSCGVQIIPDLLEYGDYSEIGSLIAPRPCVWEVGDTDPLIVSEWDEVFRDRLRRVYRALGAVDQLVFDKFVGSHVWNGRQAFPLFERVLRA